MTVVLTVFHQHSVYQNLIEFYRKCEGEFLENGIAYCENLPSYFNSGCSQLNEVLNFIDLLQ